MDLMHLLSSESSSEQEPGQWREVLYKRKGINFSTTTSEGRLLRSSQVNTKRNNERQQNYASRRNLPGKKEEKDEESQVSKKSQKDIKPGDEGKEKVAATSRKEKLKEFLEKKRIIEEAKKKKAKPAFRAGKVQHTWSGPASQGSSMSQSMLSSTVFKKPQTSEGKGKMLRSCSTLSLARSDPAQRNPSSVSSQKSFAPSNYKFSLNMKSKNPNEAKTFNKQNKTSKEATNGAIKEAEETTKQAKEAQNEVKEVTKEAKEATKETTSDVQSEVKEEESPKEVEVVRCQKFRDLLKSETERITKLCGDWEEVAKSEGDLADDVAGEVRSVVGLGRLVMAERFVQFAGLIDNCQFRKGEKQTTVEDLQGFWEMIFLQVEDVDQKFVHLQEMKDNKWERTKPKELTNVKKTKRLKSVSTGPVSQASSGLKALIASRRKAANKPVETVATVEEGNKVIPEQKKPDKGSQGTPPENLQQDEPPQMTFDGGFFQVTSPCLRKTPKLKSSNLMLRQTAASNQASASKLNANLLSPFISAMAKVSLSSVSAPTRLFNEQEVGEEITTADPPEKTELVEDHLLSVYPEVSKKPSLMPESCVDLMSFDSPVSTKKL